MGKAKKKTQTNIMNFPKRTSLALAAPSYVVNSGKRRNYYAVPLYNHLDSFFNDDPIFRALKKQRVYTQRMFDDYHHPFALQQSRNQQYEVINNREKFQLTVDVPGVKEGDIDVTIKDGNLSIEGRRIVETETSKSKSSFRQLFPLDDAVDVERFSATLKNGVLTVSAPKHIQNVIDDAKKIPVVSVTEDDPPSLEAEEGVVHNDDGNDEKKHEKDDDGMGIEVNKSQE